MTTKDSICVRCRNLYAFTNNVCITKGERHLISSCRWGGKNAGNRKQCKSFVEATEKDIAERTEALEG